MGTHNSHLTFIVYRQVCYSYSMSFIVLEGPDGAGTTFHSAKLAEALRAQGNDVLLTAEPTDSPIGKFIRKQLEEKTIPSPAALQLLFCADRAWHVDTVIKPALAAGKTVISDRYLTSTLVYGEALGLDAAWLAEINKVFPRSDTLIFALPGLDVCIARMEKRGKQDVFENRPFADKIYKLYERMAMNDSLIHIVDTSLEKEEVAKKMLQLATK